MIGLYTLCASSGALKTNQSVFGAKQFKLPEQEKAMSHYFSVQYLASKGGSFVGQIVYPIVSKDFSCFGDNRCYPVSFILASSAMFLSFVIFISGKFCYPKVDRSENVFMKLCACVMSAGYKKLFTKSDNTKKSWLDYSEKNYGKQLVLDTKKVLNVSRILFMLPLFWAIFGQSNSRWVFQANRMNGDLGFYTLKPDQMAMINAFFGLISVPLNEYIIHPFIEKFGLKDNLHKVTIGLSAASIAFLLSAIIELVIQNNSISILWLLPQNFIIAWSSVMVWIPMLSWLFAIAPASMKSVITSFLFLTNASGSLIIMSVSGFKLFKSQLVEFIVFSSLMILDTIIFVIVGRRIKKSLEENETKIESDNKINK